MSRHRAVRQMNYEDEYEDYYSGEYDGLEEAESGDADGADHMFNRSQNIACDVTHLVGRPSRGKSRASAGKSQASAATANASPRSDKMASAGRKGRSKQKQSQSQSISLSSPTVATNNRSDTAPPSPSLSSPLPAAAAAAAAAAAGGEEVGAGESSSLTSGAEQESRTEVGRGGSVVPPYDSVDGGLTAAVARLPALAADDGESVAHKERVDGVSSSKIVDSFGTVKEAQKNSHAPVRANSNQSPTATSSADCKSESTLTVDKSISARKVRDALSEYDRLRGSAKDHINMVVIGHVDAGKSTMMGCLLYQLGCVSQRTMHRLEKDSATIGKQSFRYAWILDQTEEERCRGVTMDVAHFNFETDKKSVTILDAPGHRDFVPNMITGATAADVALLVVNAQRGEFETGFDNGGQTREHTLLVRALGVSRLVVAVNQMDSVNWCQQRYTHICHQLTQYARSIGFAPADVTFVPCSGLSGLNLVTSCSCSPTAAAGGTVTAAASWYTGPTLLQTIESVPVQSRPVAEPLRASVLDVFSGGGHQQQQQQHASGVCVAARVDSGMVCAGDCLLAMPCAENVTVKYVCVDTCDAACDKSVAFAGDHVTLSLGGVESLQLNGGGGGGTLLCDPQFPVPACCTLHVRVIVFDIDMPITCGYTVECHVLAQCQSATVTGLISRLERATGRLQRRRPRHLAAQSSGELQLRLARPLCALASGGGAGGGALRAYSRVTLRANGRTVAAGVITKIITPSQDDEPTIP